MNSLGGYVSASLSAVQHSFLSGGPINAHFYYIHYTSAQFCNADLIPLIVPYSHTLPFLLYVNMSTSKLYIAYRRTNYARTLAGASRPHWSVRPL